MVGHHLILGELVDFITGKTVQDTHDERLCQEIAHLLVEKKGFTKDEIKCKTELAVSAGNKKAMVRIDFVIGLSGRTGMIVKYGPGSLVTRERPALAAARLLTGKRIPVVVVTNGEDAHVLDGSTGRKLSTGLESIPSRSELARITEGTQFDPVSEKRAEKESRILYAFEVDGACPCDETICRL